jgi:hypothetical protein
MALKIKRPVIPIGHMDLIMSQYGLKIEEPNNLQK